MSLTAGTLNRLTRNIRIAGFAACAVFSTGALLAQIPGGMVASGSVGQDPFTGNRNMGGMMGAPVAMAPSNLNGFGLFSVTGFGGWATYPSFDPQAARFTNLGSSMTGASASMGYGKVLGERSRFSLVYTPGVIVRPTDLGRSRANHMLGVNLSHGLTPRLSMNFGVNASYAEFDQFAFTPAQYSLVTSAPGSFDDLINAIAGGQYSNSQIASLLTGAPVLESAARSSIYGNQALTANANFRLGYSATPRLHIGFNSGVNRYQNVGIKGDDLGRGAALARTTGANGSLNIGYSITNRTSIGATLAANHTLSSIVQSTFLTYTGNVSQRIGQRVFATVSAGSGSVINNSRRLNTNYGSRYLVNGSLAVQATNTQTFMAQVGRTFIDQFGLGVRYTQNATGSWSYAPQGGLWSATLFAGQMFSNRAASASLNSFFTGLGLGRRLGNNFGLSGQYFYARTNNTLGAAIFGAASQGEFERNGVRVSITWFPRPIEY
jgi:hypothetical protein